MVARIFTNSIFSATLGNLSKLDCARLHENSMIALEIFGCIQRYSCDSCDRTGRYYYGEQ